MCMDSEMPEEALYGTSEDWTSLRSWRCRRERSDRGDAKEITFTWWFRYHEVSVSQVVGMWRARVRLGCQTAGKSEFVVRISGRLLCFNGRSRQETIRDMSEPGRGWQELDQLKYLSKRYLQVLMVSIRFERFTFIQPRFAGDKWLLTRILLIRISIVQ